MQNFFMLELWCHNLYQSKRIILDVFLSLICHAVKRSGLPEVGDLVHISSLGKKGKILRVEPSKEELVVQVGNMKLKLKFSDIVT